MINRSKLILLLTVWCMALLPSAIQAQPGFDQVRNHCNVQVQSRYRSVLADSQRIVFAGVALRDNAQGPCDQIVSVIGAYGYNGNLLWSKQLGFQHPVYKSGDVSPDALCKLSANRYALVSHGNLCDGTYIKARPFLYFFNQNGDSLGFAALPVTNPDALYTANTITTDAQNNILIAGIYRNHPLADTAAAWLAKFTSSGQLLWLKHLSGGDYAETALSYVERIMTGNSSGQYVLCGNKSYLDTTLRRTDDAIWKTDMQGNVIWQRNLPKYNGWVNEYSTGDHFFDIVKAVNGSGYYFAASGPKALSIPGEPGAYQTQYYCGKLSENGNVVWARTYSIDTSRSDGSLAIVQRPNGDLLIMGTSGDYGPVPDSSGVTLFCTDSLGHVKWMKLNRHYNCPNAQPEQTLVAMAIAPVSGNIVRVGGISQDGPQPGCWDTAGALSWIVYTDSLGRLNPNDTATYPLQESDVDYGPTGVVMPQKEHLRFSVYPNPVKDKLEIVLNGFAGSTSDIFVMVYDFTGKVIAQQSLSQRQINMAAFPPGIYGVQLRYKGQDWGVQKIVKL